MYIEYQDNKKYPSKDAEIADSPEVFKNAGYILTDNDLVVDVDNIDKKVLERLISLFNIKTQIVWTSRGAHFYFKKPQGFKGSRKVCPLGFEVEYKHDKNTKSITIKQAGKMRKIVNFGIREELPAIFYSRKRLEPLLGMDEHEGRNNALFAHRMKIHDLPEWQSILRFINNNIFAAPLSEEEFNTISREGIKTEAKKDNEPEVADFLLSKYKAVLYLGKLYFLEEKRFITDDEKLKRLVFSEVGLQKTRYVDEIIKQMLYKAPLIEPGRVFDIRFKNGILRNGLFIEVDYQEFTPYSIDIEYDPEAAPVQIVDDYITHLTDGDPDYRQLLLEIMAHPLIINKEFKRQLAKFFIFVGDGGNGKGVLLYIIRKILGYENCSALSIKNMTDDRFFTTMQGKLVNLGDDVNDEVINNEQMKALKNISTCDYVATRNLFEQSKNIELTISLIFTSNHILKSWEKGESYKRRVSWLPIFTKPKRKDKSFMLKVTTPEALKYWISLIVAAYIRLYEKETFTESEIVKAFNDEYHESNNTVLLFLQDYQKDFFLNRRSPEIYMEYEIFCEENGLNVQSKKLFIQSIYNVFGLVLGVKKIHGKTARVFTEATPYLKQQYEKKINS